MNDELLLKKFKDKILIKYNYKIYELPQKLLTIYNVDEAVGEDWIKLKDEILIDKIVKKIKTNLYDFTFNIVNCLDGNYNSYIDTSYCDIQIKISNNIMDVKRESLNILFTDDYCYIFYGDSSFLDIKENSKEIKQITIDYAILKALDFYVLEDKSSCFYKLEMINYTCTKHNKIMQFISYDSDVLMEIRSINDVNQDDKYSSIIDFYQIFTDRFFYKGFTEEKQIPLKLIECQYINDDYKYYIYGIGLTPMLAVLNLYKTIINKLNPKVFAISSLEDFDSAIAIEIYRNCEIQKKIMNINSINNFLTSEFDKVLLKNLDHKDRFDVEFLKLDIDYYYLSLKCGKDIVFEDVSVNIESLAESLLYMAYCFCNYKNEFKINKNIYVEEQSKFTIITPQNLSLNNYLLKSRKVIYASMVRVPNNNKILPLLTLNLKEIDYE